MNDKHTYELKESQIFDLSTFQEKRVDLQLKKALTPCSVLLTGRVMNKSCQPIANATVKVFDYDFNPLFHTLTNENGAYRFEVMLEKGKYKVVASAENYLVSKARNFEIYADCMKRIIKSNFRLENNPITEQSIIYGVAFDNMKLTPISNAKITLAYKKYPSKIVATVFTNENGQYIIYNIPPNQYLIKATHADYIPYNATEIEVEKQTVELMNLNMIKDNTLVDGTISGIIRFEGRIAAGVPVFLYAVDEKSFYKLVQIEMTNENGAYLFSSVPPGQYMVDTNLQTSQEKRL